MTTFTSWAALARVAQRLGTRNAAQTRAIAGALPEIEPFPCRAVLHSRSTRRRAQREDPPSARPVTGPRDAFIGPRAGGLNSTGPLGRRGEAKLACYRALMKVVAASGAVAALAIGCGLLASCGSDDCSPNGAPQCANATSRRVCAFNEANGLERGRYIWTSPPCDSGYCVVPASGPHQGVGTCVFAPKQVPECGSGERRACWNNSVATCSEGYVVADAPCTETCVERPGCVSCRDTSAVPDAICAQGAGATCFENAVYACSCDERGAKMEECGPKSFCVTTGDPSLDGRTSLCALSPTADPRCVSNAPGYCSDRGFVTCKRGFAVGGLACACHDGGVCE